MKFIDAVNAAYERARIGVSNPTTIVRESARTNDEGEVKIYADGVGSFFFDEFSVKDINADDWMISVD